MKPLKIDRFPPLEPGMEMDAVLAPPRNQLGHLENHWNSLHFRRPALMGDSARQRHPGGQCENLTVIGKPSKTIAYSNISHQEQDSILGERISVGSFVVGAPQNAYGNPSKTIGKHNIS